MRVISYDPLWKTLIDRKMKKSELPLSKSTLYQLSHDQSVTMDTIVKICETLDCSINDVVEVVEIK